MSPTLTTHLLHHTPTSFHRATTHPFLHAAGTGTLPRTTLAAWLSQDRLYAQSYVRFIGHLISKIRLPYSTTPTNPLEERILTILTDSLTNIQRELTLFATLSAQYALPLDTPPAGEDVFGPGVFTHAYTDMFVSAGSPGVSLLEGLVVLWATEYCYLRSWQYARGVMERERESGSGGSGPGDADGGALREAFIPNWTSGEFAVIIGTYLVPM
ncbi:heme oxygenase-like protein [Aspergillus ellipticus CBS 707.79]|uniref:Heme oxygenase-like protein n=1 Tax=Aspergillus ellipticus CBS 707.79 TaxID=1448320 RepID=A0A319D5D7_9EURO|nr:heme oxygenase-like protein [Aspergillus ellipticus CBS 707.79]